MTDRVLRVIRGAIIKTDPAAVEPTSPTTPMFQTPKTQQPKPEDKLLSLKDIQKKKIELRKQQQELDKTERDLRRHGIFSKDISQQLPCNIPAWAVKFVIDKYLADRNEYRLKELLVNDVPFKPFPLYSSR